MLKLRIDGEAVPFEITKFPDGTSQVWKFAKEKGENVEIDFIWNKDESELMHLFQLLDYFDGWETTLKMPYLPFGRQDKKVAKDTTWSLSTFLKLLMTFEVNMETFDAHNTKPLDFLMENETPEEFHKWAIEQFKPDEIFYPDAGAALRYGGKNANSVHLYGEKIRNQQTGEITGYKVNNSGLMDIKDKRILIQDDIVDGGATFIVAAKALRELGVGEIGLCVSHGIFSKGKQPLIDAGISKFYYTNSIVGNEDGFKVV